jgi:carboxyl-terminal processing protease
MRRRSFLKSASAAGAGLLAGSPAAAETPAPPTPEEVLEALWKAIRDHYPMLEYVGAYGDEWQEEFRPRVRAAGSLETAYPILEELVCRLRDYHTRFTWPNKPQRASLPILGHELPTPARTYAYPGIVPSPLGEGVSVVGDGHYAPRGSIVVVRKSAVPEIAPGEEILRLNGIPVPELLAAARVYAVGSTPEALSRSAVDRMLAPARGTEVTVAVRKSDRAPVREVRLRATGFPDDEPTVAHRALDGETRYIRIPRWSGRNGEALPERLDAALEAYRRHPYLIIDVRGNGGGSDELADRVTGRFITRKVISSISFHREVPTLRFTRTVEWCEPRGPWTYAGRVAVLTDEGCASACEHFVSGMLAAGACLVGMPTNGACGFMRRMELPGGSVLICSRTFPLHGRTPSPRHGIAPHFRVPLTRVALRTGRDEPLERARKWLRSGAPLPPRFDVEL